MNTPNLDLDRVIPPGHAVLISKKREWVPDWLWFVVKRIPCPGWPPYGCFGVHSLATYQPFRWILTDTSVIVVHVPQDVLDETVVELERIKALVEVEIAKIKDKP